MPTATTEVERGAYFTDGRRLYYVADRIKGGSVLLEDCVDGTLEWWTVKALAEKVILGGGWRRVSRS